MKLEFKTVAIAEFKDIFSGQHYERLKASILSIILRQKDMLFKNSVDPDGTPWQPLAPLSLKRKLAKNKNARLSKKEKEDIAMEVNQERGYFDTGDYNDKLGKALNKKKNSHKILVDTSHLKNSLSVKGAAESFQSIEGDEIIIGTNVEYAAIHNYGGTIQLQKKNDVQMETRSEMREITIPARPFIGMGDKDEIEIVEKINAYIGKHSESA